MRRITKFVFAWLTFFLLFAYCPIVISSPDTVTKSASSFENNAWVNPQYAYVSDNQRASEGTPYDQVTYKGFNFQNDISAGSTIDSVVIYAEGYVLLSLQKGYCVVSWDGGSNWNWDVGSIGHDMAFGTSETTKSWNVSALTAWTRDKLNETNFRVRYEYYATGGCYTNRTYFNSIDKNGDWIYKNVEKAAVGDPILVYDDRNDEIKVSRIASVDVHAGEEWVIRDVYSGELEIALSTSLNWTLKSHIQFTAEHPCAYYEDPKGPEIYGTFADLKTGYYLSHLYHDPPYFRNETVNIKDSYIKLFPITRIEEWKEKTTVYYIHAENNVYRPFLKYMTDQEMREIKAIGELLNIDLRFLFDPPPIGKQTVYIDHAYVTVNFTPAGAWTLVETWTGEFITRIWTFVETWTGELIARIWTLAEVWTGVITGFGWYLIEIWVGQLSNSARFLEFAAVLLFISISLILVIAIAVRRRT